MGKYICTANHLASVFYGDGGTKADAVKGAFFGETGLQTGDVKRQDRQSVMAAVRRCGWKLLRCLHLCKHQTLGTETYLDINQRFFRCGDPI